MNSLAVAVLSGVGFIVAYHTYGRYLARKIFGLDPGRITPSREVNDGIDYVPTRKEILFGHHFTSIAGTGPIVGPAIAVFWGWLPALLWVLIGSVFIGAVHDFGSLVVSLRQRGQTIGDIAGRMISPRARLLFLFILFFCLVVVIGIFGLVIAVIFSIYPQTVLSVWVAMPVAVGIGWTIYKRGGHLLMPSILGLLILYAATVIGVYWLPIQLDIPPAAPGASYFAQLWNPVAIWTGVLLVYCFFASVLPVWLLLQPRDYINSHQMLVTLVLMVLGLLVAHPVFVAPAINSSAPGDAPPMMPFLFITIACGAISGFHCLVSSGTSSKQLRSEGDAQFVGYGSMLLEGALAVLVILACCAGIGMGYEKGGTLLTGEAAWAAHYGNSWEAMKMTHTIGAFVDGGANMIAALGIPLKLSVGIIAVMVCCFAATTIDTATRLQRYVIQEIGGSVGIGVLKNKYWATTVAVLTGGALALVPGPMGPGSGGLIIWPLFGATNQLLAGLAFLVIIFYLLRHGRPFGFAIVPAILMIILPAWAMVLQIRDWIGAGNWLLVGFGGAVEILQVWMVAEALIMWKRARGVLPEPLPPLNAVPEAVPVRNEGGRAC
jgi:carbon starvation protein